MGKPNVGRPLATVAVPAMVLSRPTASCRSDPYAGTDSDHVL
jgi:hypothetical protein